MEVRTVNAIKRLVQSPDFKLYIDYLTEELDIHTATLIRTKDNVLMYRAQGATLGIQRLLDDVKAIQSK